jgi:UDP-N-acetyl-2-amino-2-deoxyglucuronate dehydrogenase
LARHLALDGGGALMNQGVHYVDMLRYAMGPVASVSATMGTLAHERIEVEDIVSATIQFANGAVGTLQASTALYPGYKQAIEVYGTHGTVLIEDSKIKHAQFADGTEEQGMFSVKAKPPEVENFLARAETQVAGNAGVSAAADPRLVGLDGHLSHYRDLVEAIATGRETFMNGQEARNALELIVAVYQSARTGQRVMLPL